MDVELAPHLDSLPSASASRVQKVLARDINRIVSLERQAARHRQTRRILKPLLKVEEAYLFDLDVPHSIMSLQGGVPLADEENYLTTGSVPAEKDM